MHEGLVWPADVVDDDDGGGLLVLNRLSVS